MVPAEDAPRSGTSTTAVVGAWIGAVLGAARGAVVFGMDRVVRGLDLRMTEWRVAERLPLATALGVAAGLGGCLLLARAVRSRSLPAFALTVAVAAALFLAVLAGWPFDDPYHVPDPGSTRGAQSLAVLAAGALILALTAGLALRRFARRGAPAIARGPGAVALALTLAAIVPAGYAIARGRVSETMDVSELVRELLVDESAWVVESARPEAPPTAGVIAPDVNFRLDVGEMPALLMSPPCSVLFEVEPEDGPVRLLAAAGCDRELLERYPAGRARPRVAFTIEVNGAEVFRTVKEPGADQPEEARAWARAGGADGLALVPGDRVRLRTERLDARAADAADGAEDAPLPVGFGGLELERTSSRARQRASAEAPNIVVVVMDTLCADRTSTYGYERPTTPHLDALAARGVLFERAYATSSWTWPATASILTGLPVAAHGVKGSHACWLAGELETLPEALQRAGYTTAAFTGNPLIVPNKNFDQGFETFDYSPTGFLMSDVLMPNVLTWLEAHAHLRFFLYLHLVDPHEPYRPRPSDRERLAGEEPTDLPPGYMSHYAARLLENEAFDADGVWRPETVVPPDHLRWIEEIYDASVATGDAFVGALLARLEALGLGDDTVVVFTSDHGEEFLEHGHLKHGQSVYEELVRVPLVMAGPGIAPGRVATPVENRHVAPTLAAAAGLTLPRVDDGLDLRDWSALPGGPVFQETETGWWNGVYRAPVRGARALDLALHYAPHADDREEDGYAAAFAEDRVRLFDLTTDPGETRDLADERPSEARALIELVLRRERELLKRSPRTYRAGAGTMDVLRHTGYAGEEDD